MQASDLEQVRAIDQASFSMPWPASAYTYELNENPLSRLWVAEIQTSGAPEKIIGMIVTWLILDEVHIATIAVHPEHRGQGVAQQLLITALVDALHRGIRQATLEVRASNVIAQKLYRRFGFEIAGRRPRYYKDNNEDAIIMTGSKSNLKSGVWKKQDQAISK